MSKYTVLQEGEMSWVYDDSTHDFDSIEDAEKEISDTYKDIKEAIALGYMSSDSDDIELRVVEIRYINDDEFEIYNLDGTYNRWASRKEVSHA